ncbi:MAG: YbaK/EbsC family protein [Acidimicrobiia bacterium]
MDPGRVIKTLVMETEAALPLVVLMHGDRSVSTKLLARHIGCKTVRPCEPGVAEHHSGYRVGGTSPFGLRTSMTVYLERSITDLATVFVNGGKRGFLVEISTADLTALLSPVVVDVAVP